MTLIVHQCVDCGRRFHPNGIQPLENVGGPTEDSLFSAIENNQPELIRQLLKRKDIDVNAQEYNNKTPLHYAIDNNQSETIQQLLKRKDIDVNAQEYNNKTPLHIAIEKNQPETVQQLLACKDIDVNLQDEYGSTPLHIAIEKNQPETVQQLLACKDIDVNLLDKYGSTPLHIAIERTQPETVQQLLACKDIDVNLLDKYGSTPLHIAICFRQYSLVPILLHVYCAHANHPLPNFSSVSMLNPIRAMLASYTNYRKQVGDNRYTDREYTVIRARQRNAEKLNLLNRNTPTRLRKLPEDAIRLIGAMTIGDRDRIPYTPNLDCCNSLLQFFDQIS